ncbi:MAG: OmpA family protein [Desulfovibrio sp.]
MRLKSFSMLAAVAMLTVALLCPAIASAKECGKKVDNFAFFVDYSGSMAMKHPTLNEKKIQLAYNLLKQMNSYVPALDYTAYLGTFAPNEVLYGPETYDKNAMCAAIDKLDTTYDIFNRTTPMGEGLMSLNAQLANMPSTKAIIMLTDGRSNIGADPIAEAKDIYAKYPELTIHVVSFADDDAGMAVIKGIQALKAGSMVMNITDMDPMSTEKFVLDILCAPVQAKPMPAPEPMEQVFIFRSMNFDFDKADIKDEMLPALQQALVFLLDKSDLIVEIGGHTDSVGSQAYNMKLSERRASSVKQWLVDNGIASERMRAVGYGEDSPKFDNTTEEGRALNRRCELKQLH